MATDDVSAWVEAVREEQRRKEAASEPDRDELIEALHHANIAAKRQPHVLGTAAHPSRWDNAHAHVDRLLDELVGL